MEGQRKGSEKPMKDMLRYPRTPSQLTEDTNAQVFHQICVHLEFGAIVSGNALGFWGADVC